jgi:hypothetical protein
MPTIPLKPQYGPTLGRLLEPSWRAARPLTRRLVLAAAFALLVLLIAGVLSLLDVGYSHGGAVPFSFRYRGLYRTAAGPGEYVKVARSAHGQLQDSFAVAPLRLAPYSGSVTGALPLQAAGYVRSLERRFAGFRLRGEGKTRITSTLAGYDVRYSAILDGRRMSGRDVILLGSGPTPPHVRDGVVLEMLTAERTSVAKPVGAQGLLEKPLKTFSFG